jgi:hypothetical protein
MNTAILFLVFNRPDRTQQVFDVIRKIKPKYLFVAADGPRASVKGEDVICENTRNVILNGIDWDCELKTLFQDENLGCGKAVSGGISWFFDNVSEGIILEDDCLPDISFFGYCDELLKKYRQNEEVMMISGNNFLFDDTPQEYSYYFSNFAHIWGWATWRRAWAKYDFEMSDWEEKKSEIFKSKFISKKQVSQLKKNINIVYHKRIDTWDYQWVYALLKNNGCSITPNVNLVENIGYGSGTHTTSDVPDWVSKLKLHTIGILKHPEVIVVDNDKDLLEFKNLNNVSLLKKIILKSKNVKTRFVQYMQFRS